MLLTVVDETVVVTQFAHRLSLTTGIKTAFAGSLSELPLVLEANGQPDILLVNVTGGVTGYEAAAFLRRTGYRGRVLALVDAASAVDVKHLTSVRGVECVPRPADASDLADLVQRTVEPVSAPVLGPSGSMPPAFHGIVGRSARLLDLFARIEKVAAGDANVCICGESGTGK